MFNLKGMSMAEKLTIFSTVEDLRNCSNDILEASIDAVSKDVVVAYILELRERIRQAEQGLWALTFG